MAWAHARGFGDSSAKCGYEVGGCHGVDDASHLARLRLCGWPVGVSVVRSDDVADMLVGAVRGVEFVAAPEELLELGQLSLSLLDVMQFRGQQLLHVGTRDGALTAQVEDAGDLDQGESGRLAAADEREPGQDRVVVLAVAVGASLWLGKQTPALVEADGLRRHSCSGGGFSDSHGCSLRLDLVLRFKV